MKRLHFTNIEKHAKADFRSMVLRGESDARRLAAGKGWLWCAVAVYAAISAFMLIFIPSGRIDESMLLSIEGSCYKTRCGVEQGTAFLTTDSLLITEPSLTNGDSVIYLYRDGEIKPFSRLDVREFRPMALHSEAVGMKMSESGVIPLANEEETVRLLRTHPVVNVAGYKVGSHNLTLQASGSGLTLYEQTLQRDSLPGAPVIIRHHDNYYAIGVNK